MRACRARWLTRDNARTALSNALTNSRQIQQWTLDLCGRLGDHAAGKGPNDGGARLVQVVRQAGIGFQLVRVWEGTRGLERSLKRRGGAARRCPVCRLQALGLTLPRRPTHLLDRLELGPAAAWLVTGRWWRPASWSSPPNRSRLMLTRQTARRRWVPATAPVPLGPANPDVDFLARGACTRPGVDPALFTSDEDDQQAVEAARVVYRGCPAASTPTRPTLTGCTPPKPRPNAPPSSTSVANLAAQEREEVA
jgi:hypothetical protein